jgi:hypothetical protein
MAYKPLTLDKNTPRFVRKLILQVERWSFRSVHILLRLPLKNYNLNETCDFAIAQVLMPVIGGISATLYEPTWRDNARFKGVLKDYYPWNQEPAGVDSDKTSTAVYEVFRNPLTHDLGLDVANKRKGAKIILKRLGMGTEGLSESFIEKQLEGHHRPKGISAILTISSDRQTLLLEALYWGVRRMIENISADKQRMQAAENFLANLQGRT